MSLQTLEPVLAAHRFFHGLDPAFLQILVGCSKNIRFASGDIVFTEGEPADWFYLLRAGRVTLEMAVPGRGHVVVQTVEEGEVLGWSWLFPPYRWTVTARATEPTRVVAMDGSCLRQKCENDAKLGYELMKRFAGVMVERLHAARIQMLDVYGNLRTK